MAVYHMVTQEVDGTVHGGDIHQLPGAQRQRVEGSPAPQGRFDSVPPRLVPWTLSQAAVGRPDNFFVGVEF